MIPIALRWLAGSLALAVASSSSAAVTTYTDEAGLLTRVGGAIRQVTFDDIAVGSGSNGQAFSSLGVQVSAAPTTAAPPAPPVVVTDAGGDILFHFFMAASAPNFLQTTYGLTLTFPGDVTAAGLRLHSLACSPGATLSQMQWQLLDANLAPIGNGVIDFDEGCPDETFQAVYLGLHSDTPFRAVAFYRNSGSNFVVDDAQYAGANPVRASDVRGARRGGWATDFDDVQPATPLPVISRELALAGEGSVEHTVFNLDGEYWFGAEIGATNFLLTNFESSVAGPADSDGLHMELRRLSCLSEATLTLDGYAGDGRLVDAASIRLSTECEPQSLRIDGLRPARRWNLRGSHSGAGIVNFLVENLSLAEPALFGADFEASAAMPATAPH